MSRDLPPWHGRETVPQQPFRVDLVPRLTLITGSETRQEFRCHRIGRKS